MATGFYQGWDLHPAQLVSRYAATFAFFIEGLDAAAARLKNFVAKSAQATRVGAAFDDAATGRGLVNYFRRAVELRRDHRRTMPSSALGCAAWVHLRSSEASNTDYTEDGEGDNYRINAWGTATTLRAKLQVPPNELIR